MLILTVTLVLAVSSEAKSYYLAGLRAYQMQDCVNAIKWFEKALIKDPSIEEYDPQIKFRMGYCAYILGDYDMARDYLSLYPDNPVAINLLKSINKAKEEETWKKWINIPEENQTTAATSTEKSSQTEKAAKPSTPLRVYLLMFGIFLIIYIVIFFLELKTAIISRLLMKFMGGKAITKQVEVKQVAAEIKEEKKESPIEGKEVELNLEDILNASLDTVDKLIYGDSFESESQKVENETKGAQVSEKEQISEADTHKAESEETEKALPKEEEKEEKTEKEVVMEELSHQESDKETLTEEDMNEVMKKADKVLKELEDVEESTPIDFAGKDIDELIEELEEKNSYEPEDAEAFMYILSNLVERELVKEQETGEDVEG